MQTGHELRYLVFAPKHPRYRNGPGTTGDELMKRIDSNEFPPAEKFKHSAFIYGFFWRNTRRYYMAYRLSGDPYYVEQLRKHARAMDWILRTRPVALQEEQHLRKSSARRATMQQKEPKSGRPRELFSVRSRVRHPFPKRT